MGDNEYIEWALEQQVIEKLASVLYFKFNTERPEYLDEVILKDPDLMKSFTNKVAILVHNAKLEVHETMSVYKKAITSLVNEYK